MCRLKKGGKTFEALTHHGAVEQWREKKLGFDKVCVVDAVFKNHSKGERFADADLIEVSWLCICGLVDVFFSFKKKNEQAFGTSDIGQVLQVICEKGEVQQVRSQFFLEAAFSHIDFAGRMLGTGRSLWRTSASKSCNTCANTT